MNAATHALPTAATRTPTPAKPGEHTTPSYRGSGRIIGALFLAGFLTYGTGAMLTTSVLDSGDVVGSVSARQTAFAFGAVLMLTVTALDIGKAVLFFPLLGRPGRRTALTYLAGMVTEVTLMAFGVIALLALVPLGDQVHSGSASAATGQALGTFAVSLNDLAYQSGQAALGVGAFFLTVFLYRSGMVPRLLAGWGVVGYVLQLSGAVAELFGVHISMFLLVPGGLFEVTFGVWLLTGALKPSTVRPLDNGNQ